VEIIAITFWTENGESMDVDSDVIKKYNDALKEENKNGTEK